MAVRLPIIDSSQPLVEEYARLAIKERKLRLAIESGEVKCLNCNRPKKEHCPHDARCTSYVTSLKFRCNEVGELEKVSTALKLIEELMGLLGELQ